MPSDHPPNEIILSDDSTDDDFPAAAPAPVASTYGPSTTPRVSAPSAKKESVDVSPGVGSSKSARPFECSNCAPPSSFLSFAKLEEHRSADVHSVRSDGQRPSRRGLECPECDQQSQFSSSSALQSHWNTYHAKFAIVELPDGQTCYVPKEKGGFPCPFEHCGRHITNVLKLTAIHFKVGGCSLAERWPFPIPSNWRTDKPEGMLVLPKRPLGRPPGRPRKSLPDVVVPKRPVGRPRKSLPATLEAGQPPTTNVSSDPTTGTPVAGPSSTAGPPPKPSSSEPKRPVGRPRKSLTATVEPGLSSSANVASTFSPGSSAQPAPRPAAQTNLPVPYGSSIPSQDRAEPLAISEGLGAEWMRPANIWASVVKARSDLSQSLPTSSAVDSTNDSRRIANEIALAEGRKHRRSPLGSSEDGPASKRMKMTSSDGANQFWPPKSISESVPIPSIKRARATPFLLSKDSFSNKSDEGSSRTGKSALSGRSANDERTAAERALCKTLSLTPQRYAAIKTKLLDEYRSTEVKPRRGTSSKLCETDVNKTGKLLEFFTGIGCFGSENQDRVLSKAKKKPTPMSLLASFEGSRKSLSADERTTFRFSMIHRMQKLERMLDRKETVQTVVKQPRKGAGVVVGRGDAASGPTPDKLPKKGAGVQVDVD